MSLIRGEWLNFMEEKVRVDKWIWAVRIFKTRSLAAAECDKGHVSIDSIKLKPSKELKGGEVIKVRIGPIERHYLVKGLLSTRLSAPLVAPYVEDVTPQETLDLMNAIKVYGYEKRDKGLGRPTKRDRRMIDKFKN